MRGSKTYYSKGSHDARQYDPDIALEDLQVNPLLHSHRFEHATPITRVGSYFFSDANQTICHLGFHAAQCSQGYRSAPLQHTHRMSRRSRNMFRIATFRDYLAPSPPTSSRSLADGVVDCLMGSRIAPSVSDQAVNRIFSVT